MEDVLDVYTRPHDPDIPLVCLDETSKQLVFETRTPLPMKPGQPERIDYEYERGGTANLFMLFAPLEGFRHIEVTDHRKTIDYAKILKDLSTSIFRAPRRSLWCRTISTRTPEPRFTQLSRPLRPGGLWSDSNGITRPNTAAGSTWRNPSWAFWLRNVWTGVSRTKKH